MQGKQRFKCKNCNKDIREGDLREKYNNNKRMRVSKCYLEGLGIRTIERLEGVSNPLIIKWIRNFAKELKFRL